MEGLSKLAAALKRCRPHKLRVISGDDTRDVAVPSVRNKVARVLETVGGLGGWSRVDLLDKSGDLLATVEGDEDSTAQVAPTSLMSDADARATARDERMLGIMLRAQEVALKYRDAETQALLRNTAEVTRVLTDSVKQLASIHREQLAAAVDAAHAEADAAQTGNMSQLLEAAPQLLAMLPHLGKFLGGAKS